METSMSRAPYSLAALALLAATLAHGGAARAEMLKYHADMSSATEVPAKQTGGKGDVSATLDTATRELTWTSNWSGLTGPATMAHFHGPAAPGANAGVAVPWDKNPTSPYQGKAMLTEQQVQDLEAGKWYANVHTAANPGGEIRGQMTTDK
jgi:hypothetical protein